MYLERGLTCIAHGDRFHDPRFLQCIISGNFNTLNQVSGHELTYKIIRNKIYHYAC
jgi:hypothetical protein